nr:undecaprenyl-phosphate glucose phosphotransferase [Cohnella zeiphila]
MVLVFLAAYWLKFYSGLMVKVGALPFQIYFSRTLIFIVAAILIGYFAGFYAPRRKKSLGSDIWTIFKIQTTSLVFLVGFLYAAKEVHISREFLLLFYALNLFVLSAYRIVLKQFLNRIRRKGFNKRYVLILGAGSVGREFYERLQQYPEMGYEVFGFLDDHATEHPHGYAHLKPIIGTLDDLESILQINPIDEVIIALPLDAHGKYPAIIDICDNAGAKTLIIPDYFDILPARPFFDNFAGMPMINIRDIPLDEFGNRIAKRGFDIAFSLIALLVSTPFLLIAIAGIKLTSPGPVFFIQERMGLDRKTFRMFKLRTMHIADSKTSDTQWTTENDPRRTRFGALLRKLSVDELPQFINVLKGDMSVVGPRPERPYFVEQFKRKVPKYMVKHHIRPGITGWAQANGLRGDTSIKDRIDHDLFYIEHWSFLFDLKIIARTIRKGIVDKNAY